MKTNKKKGFQSASVYEILKSKIINLEIEPGAIIDEKKLMAELGVSRTPIRDAVLRLKSDDLIVNHPNKTAYVKEITLRDIKEISEALINIEKLTTSFAAQRMDSDTLEEIKKTQKTIENEVLSKNYRKIVSENRKFHSLIANACENKYIITVHEIIRNQAFRLSCLSLSKDFATNPRFKSHHQRIVDQHQMIVSFLEKRDAEKAANVAVEHIKLFQERIMFYIN